MSQRISTILFLFMSVCMKMSFATERPHIILIVADDLGYNDVSFHGSNQIPTPNLDFLAYNGILLNNYYVSPICTPTRSALMTGRHPIHTGLQSGVISTGAPYGLPLAETVFPEYLNELGYRSHMVGKWHLGMFDWKYTPLHRGFKSHLGYFQGKEDYFSHEDEGRNNVFGLDFWLNSKAMQNYTDIYSTHIFRDEAVRIIEHHDQSQPLFLYLPFQSVHSANKHGDHLQAPNKTVEKFKYIENMQRRIYAAMVSELDQAVGQVYDSLKSTGMLENSIIVFTTDNGGPANGFDVNAANNFPLRGMKNTLWEGGVRAVGFLHSPLLETLAYVSNQMLHVCDWLPTLYHAAGGNASSLNNLDGVDAWDMLTQNGSPVRHEMLHNIDPRSDFAGIRVGDFKLLVGDVGTNRGKWYPPYQLDGDEWLLHYSNFSDHVPDQLYRNGLHDQYQDFWDPEIIKRMQELNSFIHEKNIKKHSRITTFQSSDSSDQQKDYLKFISENQVSKLRKFSEVHGSPVTVKCGDKPANASTNCQPTVSPCLFHIPSDPCEYNNLAQELPDIVRSLYKRLQEYASTMVPPGNKPVDPNSYPKFHNGIWAPWL